MATMSRRNMGRRTKIAESIPLCWNSRAAVEEKAGKREGEEKRERTVM